jgi:hypothetical protein
MALALAVTLDPVKLAAKLDVSGFAAPMSTLTLSRVSPSGSSANVRGAVGVTVSGSTYTARDYEIPLGLTVTYTATAYTAGGAVSATATATFTIPYADCEAWLCDLARPTNSVKLELESLRELDYLVPSGVHRVLDRRSPVVVALPAWTPAAELIVLTETLDERDQVRNLLGTGYPFLVRTAPELGIGNAYFALTEFVEERFLQLGTAPERRFRVACVQIERPSPSIYAPIPPNIYSAVKATYATYTALKAANATYDVLAYTYPAGVLNPIKPWLPDDV